MVPRVPWNPSFMKVLIILYYDKLTRSVGPVDYNSPTGTLYLMSSKIILTVAHLQVLWSEFWSPRAQLVSCTRPLPSPVLDVLHHQHGEGRVWPLWQGFCDRCWNVVMTNESSARVIIAFLQTRVHAHHSMVTTMSRCLE